MDRPEPCMFVNMQIHYIEMQIYTLIISITLKDMYVIIYSMSVIARWQYLLPCYVSSVCNLFEDQAPVDEIYAHPIFKLQQIY